MGNINGPGCCNTPGGDTPGSCTYTVILLNACAPHTPVSGATVTIKDGAGTTICSGSTDGTGTFTCSPSVPSSAKVTVTYMGCTGSSTIGCNTPLTLYYCKFTTEVTVTGPSDTYLTIGSAFTAPIELGTNTIIGTCTAQTGLTWDFTYCFIDTFDPCLLVPSNVTFIAQSPTHGWTAACVTYSPVCGGDYPLDMSLFFWDSCYVDTNAVFRGGQNQCCFVPCLQHATGQGYYPKQIDVRWTSIINSDFPLRPPCNLFANDEATWITLTLISDTLVPIGAAFRRELRWSTGCRGGQGNFVSWPSTLVNNIGTYDTCQDDFESTSIDIITSCQATPFLNFTGVSYKRFANTGCVATTFFPNTCLTNCQGIPMSFCDFLTSFVIGGGMGPTCSPVDFAVDQDQGNGCFYSLEMRETPC